MLGSNYTFLVTVHHEGRELPAVYKPLRGEQPLWDFPENTLARREVAAYLVSEALGFHFVPYTMLRDDGPGLRSRLAAAIHRIRPGIPLLHFQRCRQGAPASGGAV